MLSFRSFLVLAVVRLSLRPLRRVASAARRVAELPLDSGEVELPVRVDPRDTDPHTEVGQVADAGRSWLSSAAFSGPPTARRR